MDNLEKLLEELKSEDCTNREEAAEDLGRLGDIRASDSLIAALKDEEPYVRGAVAVALGALKVIAAVELLIDMLKTEYRTDVLRDIAFALGKIGDKRAIEPLRNVVKNRPKCIFMEKMTHAYFSSESEYEGLYDTARKALDKMGYKGGI